MISSPGWVCLGDPTPGSSLHARLDDLASANAEIVPLVQRLTGPSRS
jgi:hypothetical protein